LSSIGGFFITFEGGEASGKSTQAEYLRQSLAEHGYSVKLFREPGGTSLGSELRQILKFSDYPMNDHAELFLFLAARAQLVREQIVPALSQGEIVICDRFTDSTTAYQGYGKGLQMTQELNSYATGGLSPDLTILLDVPLQEARNRRPENTYDRFEKGSASDPISMEFHQRVREGFLSIAREEKDRWMIIDASEQIGEIANSIWKTVLQLLSGSGR